ncbi:MAG: YncE family protein [Candidatus Marsarchaeota archaeon]|nr:YncE family protein [Candidatus Marsarchaeota archaeon]
MAISPDGSYGYAISSKLHAAIANVIIFNTSTGVVSGSVPGTGQSVYVAFSPDGKYAYDAINCENGGCTNGEIEIISTATNTVVGSITSGIYNPWGIAFSPSSPYAYVANDNFPTGNITIINTHTGTVTGTITSGIGVPRGISFSPNGKYAYVVNDNYSFSNPLDLSANVVIIDTSTDRVVGSVTSGIINPMDVAVAPSGAFAYIADCYIVNGNYC